MYKRSKKGKHKLMVLKMRNDYRQRAIKRITKECFIYSYIKMFAELDAMNVNLRYCK